VRELAHEMKRLLVLARGSLVTETELSPEIQKAGRTTVPMSSSLPPQEPP
jgi:hypothetical protein